MLTEPLISVSRGGVDSSVRTGGRQSITRTLARSVERGHMTDPKCIFRAGCPTKTACHNRGYCGAGTDRSRDALPPDELVGALQDRVHKDLPGARAGIAVKASLPSNPKTHPTPWRIEHVNVPLADTGDYDGLTKILAANGDEVAHWWNADDIEEALAERIVQTANAHETSGDRLEMAERLLRSAHRELSLSPDDKALTARIGEWLGSPEKTSGEPT